MQFFMLIDLFGFIPHMSIWLTTNTDFLPPQLVSSTCRGNRSLIGNQVAGWLLQWGLRFSLIWIGPVLMGTVLMLFTQDLLLAVDGCHVFWHHAWRVDADAWPANYPD